MVVEEQKEKKLNICLYVNFEMHTHENRPKHDYWNGSLQF